MSKPWAAKHVVIVMRMRSIRIRSPTHIADGLQLGRREGGGGGGRNNRCAFHIALILKHSYIQIALQNGYPKATKTVCMEARLILCTCRTAYSDYLCIIKWHKEMDWAVNMTVFVR